MLQSDVLPDNGEAFRQPVLESGGRFEDVHERKGSGDGALGARVFGMRFNERKASVVYSESGRKVGDLLADALLDFRIADVGKDIGDPAANQFHLRLAHAARSNGGAAETYAARFHRRQRVEGDRVFVYSDAGAVEGLFRVRAGDAAGMHFNQEQMIVGTATDDAESSFHDGRGHRFRVRDHLLLVFLEGRLHRLFEAHGFGGDRVDDRAALRAREGQLVQFFGVGGFAKNHAAARAAQRLVRGGGNDVGVGNRAWMDACGDQSRDVRHVHEKERADGLGGFAHALEIDNPRIGAGAGHNHFRLVLVRELVDLVVIDALVFLSNAVSHELVHAAGKIQRMAVREVAAMRQVHAQHGVSRLKRAHVDGHVRLRARVRLDVGVFRAEKFFRAVNGQLLHLVYNLAAAVVTLA